MHDDQYQPISCSAHDLYEIAIMRHQTLELSWWEGGLRCSALVRPVDIRAHEGAEYLLVHAVPAGDEVLEIRLDRIISSKTEEP